jgi:hypothetical protein
MKGKSLITENRELAFRIWCDEGTNVKKTLSRLNKDHGFPLSMPTIYDWINRFDWKGRLARLDAAQLNTQDLIVDPLVSIGRQIEKYDKHFEALGDTVDNEAMGAYTNILKTRALLIEKQRQFKGQIIIEFMRELINYLSKNDPDSVAAIEKHFVEFSNIVRDKYA